MGKIVTITNLTGGGSSSAATSYPTASITPSANKIVLVSVGNFSNSATAGTPTISGCGMTWTQIATVDSGGGAGSRRATVFRGVSGSPSTGALTIDFGGATQNQCSWEVDQVTKAKTSGSNGADAIVQSATATNTGTTTGITVTLGAFSSRNNATFGFDFSGIILTINPGTDFTQLGFNASGAGTAFSEYAQDNQTSVPFTWSSTSVTSAAIALEIRAESTFQGSII